MCIKILPKYEQIVNIERFFVVKWANYANLAQSTKHPLGGVVVPPNFSFFMDENNAQIY